MDQGGVAAHHGKGPARLSDLLHRQWGAGHDLAGPSAVSGRCHAQGRDDLPDHAEAAGDGSRAAQQGPEAGSRGVQQSRAAGADQEPDHPVGGVGHSSVSQQRGGPAHSAGPAKRSFYIQKLI